MWNDNILEIQHVGSTAIPNICAKPILDIAIKLKSIELMEVQQLEKLGYRYCGIQHGNANYHLFVLRNKHNISFRHLHCYAKEEKGFGLQVGFRDYLNNHIDIAVKYDNLKKELAEKYPEDRAAYTRGKERFIQSIYHVL